MSYFTIPERIVRNLIKKGGTLTKKQVTKSVNRTTAEERNKALNQLENKGLITIYIPREDEEGAWLTGRVTTYITVTDKGEDWFNNR